MISSSSAPDPAPDPDPAAAPAPDPAAAEMARLIRERDSLTKRRDEIVKEIDRRVNIERASAEKKRAVDRQKAMAEYVADLQKTNFTFECPPDRNYSYAYSIEPNKYMLSIEKGCVSLPRENAAAPNDPIRARMQEKLPHLPQRIEVHETPDRWHGVNISWGAGPHVTVEGPNVWDHGHAERDASLCTKAYVTYYTIKDHTLRRNCRSGAPP